MIVWETGNTTQRANDRITSWLQLLQAAEAWKEEGRPGSQVPGTLEKRPEFQEQFHALQPQKITATWGFHLLFCKMGTSILALSVSRLFVKVS